MLLELVYLARRRKKITPGSLMKALMRPGGGDSRPSDSDQVFFNLVETFFCIIPG